MVTKVAPQRSHKHINFSRETYTRLLKYLEKNYGPNRGVSLVVDRAVREFLDREGA